MKSKNRILCALIAVTILLTGCSMRTIDQMYCLPKRSEGYMNLQSAVDSAMSGLEYHAPVSGDHQQSVQMIDLDGDGTEECLAFAKGGGEKPLKVLIFKQVDGNYVHVDTIENHGTAFEQVQYVHFSNRKGYDLILGRQLTDQMVRPMSVYSMSDGKMVQLLNTQYAHFLTPDLNDDGMKELMILRSGENSTDNAIAEIYSVHNGMVEHSQEVNLSEPVDKIKRIMVNRLADGPAAVYVASNADGNAVITDVFALLDGVFTNVSLSNESGTSVQTLRNYYVYAEDVDQDGILELPYLIPASIPGEEITDQHLIRWYAMDSKGSVIDKMYTYHSFANGWYLELPTQIVNSLSITQFGNSYAFSVADELGNLTKLMTVYAFTGTEREEMAISDNRFVLYRTESTVYAGHLEVASASLGITKDTMIHAFHLIAPNGASAET